MKFSTRTREIIRNRANGYCEVCGMALRIYAQIHHRRPRGMGGTRQADSASPANGLYVHQKCHDTIERNRATGLRKGWLVRQGDDPAQIPVQLWTGWHLLKDDGSVEKYRRGDVGGEASSPVGSQMTKDAEGSVDTDGVERANEIVPDGIATDHSDDSPLADAKFGSDDVGRDAL